MRTIAPGGEDRHRRSIAVIAAQRDHREVHHLGDLVQPGASLRSSFSASVLA
jgi:hypothetical protein